MNKPNEYARRFVEGGAIVFTGVLIAGLLGFIVRMVLARSLTVSEYGLFYGIVAFFSFFIAFRNLGLENALVKYISEFAAKKQLINLKSIMVFVLWIEITIGIAISSVIFIFSAQIAESLFGTLDAVLLIKILSIWFLMGALFSFLQAVFRGYQEMSVYTAIYVANTLLILLLTLLLVNWAGLGVAGAAWAYLGAILIVCGTGIFYIIKRHGCVFRVKTHITKPFAKKILIFSISAFLVGIGSTIITTTDTIMITAFRTLNEVGLYQVVQPISLLLRSLVSTLAVVLLPMISELWAKKEKEMLTSAIHFLFKFSYVLVIPAIFIFLVFPDNVLCLFFGPAFLEGSRTLQILTLVIVPYTLVTVLNQAALGTGNPFISTKTIAFMATINFSLNLSLIPLWGIEGAALSTLIAHMCGLFLLVHLMRKITTFTFPAGPILKTIVGGSATVGFMYVLKSILNLSSWIEAVMVVAIGIFMYVLWILRTGIITTRDLKLVNNIVFIPKKLQKILLKLTHE